MKRILQIIIPLILIIGIIWFSINYFKDNNELKSDEIFTAIPKDSPFILEVKDIQSLLKILDSDNDIHKSFLELKSYNEFFNNILKTDSIIRLNTDSDFKEFNQPFIITAGLSGKDKSNYLFLTHFSSKRELIATTNFLEAQLSNNEDPEIHNYEGTNILTLKQDDGSSVCFASTNGFLFLSKSQFLIESSIQQLEDSDNLLSDTGFKKILETAGKNSLLNLFINHKYVPDYLNSFFANNYQSDIKELETYSNWSEFDLTLKEKELFLNGFSFTPDEDKYLHIFNNQSPIENTIENVLPESTSIFASFGISNVEKFRADLKDYRGHTHSLSDIQDRLSSIKSEYKVNLEELIYPILDKEVAYVVTDINSVDIKKNAFAVIKTNSQSSAKENMDELLSRYASKKKQNTSAYYNDIKVDNEFSYRIFRMPFADFGSLLFGNIFNGIECNYYTYIDNYIILGKTTQAVMGFINSNRLDNTLTDDENYINFSSQLAGKSNFYFYSALARSTSWFSNYLSSTEFSDPDNFSAVFQNFHALSFQFSASSKEGILINDIYLKHDPIFTDKPHTVFERGLDTSFVFKPALVKNHTTGKKEIFVQDKGNKIYLINHTGTILWEKKIDEPIISEIYQIDYFKNNKLQYMFNTANKLYLIDRNNKYVDRYPVTLNSPATAGIGVYDYENKKDYRIFVPCENKKVYLYSKEGEVVDGWKFNESEHQVNSIVQHFLVDDKDYIVFNDKNKSYILNRKGRNRVKQKSNFTTSKNGKFILDKVNPEKNSKLVITSPDGTINFVDFKGKVTSKKIKDYTENHFFDFQDVDGDGKRDYIFVDNNKLEVYNQKQKLLFDYEFDSSIDNRPVYYEFPGNNKKIGITSASTNELFLINSDGSLYEGFPLYGNTLFSIGSLNRNRKFNLFVGAGNKFLYNYEVK